MLDIFMRQGPEIKRIYQTYRRILRWLKARGLVLEDVRKLMSPGEFLTVEQGVHVPELGLKVSIEFFIPDVGNVEPQHREFDRGFVVLVVDLDDDDGIQSLSWFSNDSGHAHRDTHGGSWLESQADELRQFARRQPDFMFDLVKRVVERRRK